MRTVLSTALVAAMALALAACGTNSNNNGDGGTNNSCTPTTDSNVTCSNGDTAKKCGTQIQLVDASGTVQSSFNCVSATDCTAAEASASSACGTSSGGDGGTPKTYCDGAEYKDGSGNEVVIDGYQYVGSSWTGSEQGSPSALNGLWAISGDDGTSTILYATSAGDLSGTAPSGGNAAPATPSGSNTIAAIQGGSGTWTGTVTISGVVIAAGKASSKTGTYSYYIEDPVASGGTPAAHSGVEVYVSKGQVNGAASTPPAVGDYVTVSGTAGAYKGANEMEKLTAQTTVASGVALPPPYVVNDASQASTGNGAELQAYLGVYISVKGPFTKVPNSDTPTTEGGACPAAVQYTPTTGG